MSLLNESHVDDQSVVGDFCCAKCGKLIVCREIDAIACAIRSAWPQCCSEIMSFKAIPSTGIQTPVNIAVKIGDLLTSAVGTRPLTPSH
jgi:hypothetical protein